MCKSCGKQFLSRFCFGFWIPGGAGCNAPCVPGATCQDLSAYVLPLIKTARDCLRLVCIGQAKSVRRSRKCCTYVAQVFHRRFFGSFARETFISGNFSSRNFFVEEFLHMSAACSLRKSSFTSVFFC